MRRSCELSALGTNVMAEMPKIATRLITALTSEMIKAVLKRAFAFESYLNFFNACFTP